MTDERIIEIGKRYFRTGHRPESIPVFVAAVRECLAANERDVQDLSSIQMETPRRVTLEFETAAAAEDFLASIAKDSV